MKKDYAFDAKIGVDTAENELSKDWRPKFHFFNRILRLDAARAGDVRQGSDRFGAARHRLASARVRRRAGSNRLGLAPQPSVGRPPPDGKRGAHREDRSRRGPRLNE